MLQCFDDSPIKLYLADEKELSRYHFPPALLQQLLDKDLRGVEQILVDCLEAELSIITFQDANYPCALDGLVDPPLVLYVKGVLPPMEDTLTLSMVGARECTLAGVHIATTMAMELTKAGAILITGMAEGIDSAAVEGALKVNGPLVSVVAGGIDLPFPRQNSHLYDDVAQVGAILSEYPPKTPHSGRHFRPRNRILSGLANGVFVVECRKYGGTMMTATLAEEQQKDLFALPGDIRAPMSEGPHALIQHHGALLVQSASDILVFYQKDFPLLGKYGLGTGATAQRVAEVGERVIPKKEKKSPAKKPSKTKSAQGTKEDKDVKLPDNLVSVEEQKTRFTDDQILLLKSMGKQTQSVDALVELTQMPTKRVLSGLMMLEMDGAVNEVANRHFKATIELAPYE